MKTPESILPALLVLTSLALASPAAGQTGVVFCTCHEGLADPCAVPDSSAGCANSTGVGATLLASGSASVLADDLVLTVEHLKPGQFGIVFMGGGQTSIPFGDGVRCVSPGPKAISRFPARQSDAAGSYSEGPGIAAFANLYFDASLHPVAGCTYYFQGWYRDAGGPCGSSFNLTNGLGVTFNAGGLTTSIRGRVFADYNANGAFDESEGELPLEGWKVRLESTCGTSEVFSDADGFYEVLRDRDGLEHVVTSIAPPPGYVLEVVPGRWLATVENPVVVVADVEEVTVDFGAAFLTNTFGPTYTAGIGYWHNAGEPLLAACDPLWREVLNDLCLRTNQTQADPALEAETLFLIDLQAPFADEFQRLADYLTGATHGVLAYNLSKQFAATNLNYSCGPLAGETVFVDRFGTGELFSLEDMIAQTRELLCMPCAANSGPGGDEYCRELIMNCLTEWEGLNSDGSRTYTVSRDPGEYFFISPY